MDLKIKAKGLLCRETLDFQALLKNCRLHYGGYNPFFVLEEENHGDVGLLYNPHRMARGIYFDGSKKDEGEVTLSFNLPTSPSEIHDVIRVVTEVKLQYRNVELISDGVVLTVEEFIQGKDNYLDYSLSTLRGFCETKSYECAILTLAAYPYTLTPDEMEHYGNDGTLEEFEELLHQKQTVDAQYVCPKIMKKNDTEEVVAFYTLVEDCACIMPVAANCFLNGEQVPIERGLVRFYIDSHKCVLDGHYDYDHFVAVLLEYGAEYFDGDHLYLPAFQLAELEEIASEIQKLSQQNQMTP